MKTYLIDVDDVIYKSKKRLVQYLNILHNRNVDYRNIQNYSCTCQFPETNEKEVEDIFDDACFYTNIEIFKGAKKTINNISEYHNVIFITKGNPKNIYHKSIRLSIDFPNIPFVSLSHGLSKKLITPDSEIVIIDDVESNLYEVNVVDRILFCPDGATEYNKNAILDRDVIKIRSWKELCNAE